MGSRMSCMASPTALEAVAQPHGGCNRSIFLDRFGGGANFQVSYALTRSVSTHGSYPECKSMRQMYREAAGRGGRLAVISVDARSCLYIIAR